MTLLAVFGPGLVFFKSDLLAVPFFLLILGFITFLPKYRRLTLALSPILLFFGRFFHSPLQVISMFSILIVGIIMYLCARRWPQSRFGQRPVLFLLTGFTLLILLASAATANSLLRTILWSLDGIAASCVWYIGFALLDRNSVPSADLSLELVRFHPIGIPNVVPIPKGAAYLRRIEAENPEQLAIAQLKGLKLLAWAILLAVFYKYWNSLFHGYLLIPSLTDALAMSVKGTPVAWQSRWEGLILFFFESILATAIFTHKIVACCRMAGYNALRGTYRPLSSRTIAEFFNRYSYYFKELLVDFFFYPAFLRYWKGHRRLRMIFATFAAACFGNAFLHFTEDWTVIRDIGLWRALASYQSLFFCCIVLATALSISQLRKRGPMPSGFFRGRLLPIFGVGFFYCLLNVFGCAKGSYPLIEHLRYLASLFFIRF